MLTISQQSYAAIDAWACVEIYNYLCAGKFHPEECPYHIDDETAQMLQHSVGIHTPLKDSEAGHIVEPKPVKSEKQAKAPKKAKAKSTKAAKDKAEKPSKAASEKKPKATKPKSAAKDAPKATPKKASTRKAKSPKTSQVTSTKE